MSKVLYCGGKTLNLDSPQVMGILNVTPDSFSDGGRFVDLNESISQAARMIEAGAAIIDVGGESTRPGAQPVTVDEECRRVIPVISAISKRYPDTILSVDTCKPEVMKQAIEHGAGMVNDVNALRTPGAVETLLNNQVSVCLMHMQGQPRTMQENPQYSDVVIDVMSFLQQRIMECVEKGISNQRIVIDPGFGFGKNLQHNITLLKNLPVLADMDVALMVGLSRKSMLGTITGKPVERRMPASVAMAMLSMLHGANIIRVHDVDETIDAVKIFNCIQ